MSTLKFLMSDVGFRIETRRHGEGARGEERRGDIDQGMNCMGLVKGESFMITRNGQYYFGGSRQYYIQSFPNGISLPGFLVHDQIGNKLFLGSYYGLDMNILGKTP